LRRLNSIPFVRNNRALSYTVSAVLITGTTIILVLIASIYAYQVLEQQKGVAEFEVAKKSVLSFNDALENVAWTLQRARSTRFTAEYGHFELAPNAYAIGINATVGSSTWPLFSGSSGKVAYRISNKYTSFGEGYTSYILGNSSNIIVGSTDTYGRAVISQKSGWASIALDYRVRAMTSVVKVSGADVNYVDVWVIKLKMLVTQPWSYVHDFDLKAKCTSVQTATNVSTQVSGSQNAMISVKIGSTTDSGSVPLVSGKVVFNVVVSEVQVYV